MRSTKSERDLRVVALLNFTKMHGGYFRFGETLRRSQSYLHWPPHLRLSPCISETQMTSEWFVVILTPSLSDVIPVSFNAFLARHGLTPALKGVRERENNTQAEPSQL